MGSFKKCNRFVMGIFQFVPSINGLKWENKEAGRKLKLSRSE